MIPSRAAIVHLYDINTREFVITCAIGAHGAQLLVRRHSENDAILSAAMRKRRALVLSDASDADVLVVADRLNVLGGAKSLIVTPVMKGGRFLGAIEVMNPNDNLPFTENEGNAMDYIADQFGEFLAERGVVVDPERILKHPASVM